MGQSGGPYESSVVLFLFSLKEYACDGPIRCPSRVIRQHLQYYRVQAMAQLLETIVIFMLPRMQRRQSIHHIVMLTICINVQAILMTDDPYILTGAYNSTAVSDYQVFLVLKLT